MEFFKSVPMKYRLLVVVFLPGIFLIWSVWNDYKVIQKENRVQELMVFVQKVAQIAVHSEAVSGLSKATLINKDSGNGKELLEFRARLDGEVGELKELANKDEGINGLNSIKSTLQPLFNKYETMRQINSQVDNHTISYNEMDAFFDGYNQTAISVINSVSDQVTGSFSVKILFELIAIMEQALYASNERSILYQVFQEDKMTQEQFIEFVQNIAVQEAFKISFHDIATNVDDQLYDSDVNNEIVSEAQKLQKIALEKGTAGDYGVKPQEWWQKQTAKVRLLMAIQVKIIDRNNEILKEIQKEHQLNLLLRVLVVMATLFISFLLIFINLRSLARKLQEEINVLSTSGEEIGKSITETASGTSETATAVAETTTTVEELKQTAQVATEKAKNVADVSDEALQTLQRSENSIEATIQGMNSIQEGMGLISESIVKLSEHSQLIREIIDTVNDLAEQSHILAVNAAIESAKAGDQGKGFAVVAQEVRSLAEQSKQATIQVRNILNDIQNATSSAVMATEKGSKAVANGLSLSAETNEAIKSLSVGINNVAQAASQIALSSQQQLIGVDQLTIAMSNIKTASNQQVNNMSQIETGIYGMNAVGQSLKQVIQECKM